MKLIIVILVSLGSSLSFAGTTQKMPLNSGVQGLNCSYATKTTADGSLNSVDGRCTKIDQVIFVRTSCRIAWSPSQNLIGVSKDYYGSTFVVHKSTPIKSNQYMGVVNKGSADAALQYLKTQFPQDCVTPEVNLQAIDLSSKLDPDRHL